MARRFVQITVLMLLSTHSFAVVGYRKTQDTATLIVNRPSYWVGSLVRLEVYVNERKIGAVSNGDRFSFTYRPAADGKNTIRIYGPSPILKSLDSKSKTISFFALPGSSLEAKVAFRTTNDKGSSIDVNFLPEKPVLVSVLVNPKMKSEVVKELPPVKVPFGTSHEYSRSITIAHTVETTDRWLVEGQAQASLWNFLSVGIRAQVEKQTRQSYETVSTYTPRVTLHGRDRGGSTYRVFWVQYYRTGVCTYRTSHGLKNVSFQIADDCDLSVEKYARR